MTQTRPFAFADAISPAFGGGAGAALGVFAAGAAAGVAAVAVFAGAAAGAAIVFAGVAAVFAGAAAGAAAVVLAGAAGGVAVFDDVALVVFVVVAVVFVEVEAAGAVPLVFDLSFVVLVVVVFELVVDVAGAWAITRLAQSTEPNTNNRVFFILILKLLSIAHQAAYERGQLRNLAPQMLAARSRSRGLILSAGLGYLPDFAGWFAMTSLLILV